MTPMVPNVSGQAKGRAKPQSLVLSYRVSRINERETFYHSFRYGLLLCAIFASVSIGLPVIASLLAHTWDLMIAMSVCIMLSMYIVAEVDERFDPDRLRCKWHIPEGTRAAELPDSERRKAKRLSRHVP